MPDRLLLSSAWPELASELQALTKGHVDEEGRRLAIPVETVEIVGCCACLQANCQTFYAVRPTDWPEHRDSIDLDPDRGLMILGFDEETHAILKVEVLDRGDLRPRFQELRRIVGVIEP